MTVLTLYIDRVSSYLTAETAAAVRRLGVKMAGRYVSNVLDDLHARGEYALARQVQREVREALAYERAL